MTNNNFPYRRMSITSSSCEEICHSPHNQSKSKMLYSFSKGPRFDQYGQLLCHNFYDIGSTNSKRSTNFGFGNKYDFTKNVVKSPPPTAYHLLSGFTQQRKKGFGFGYGRSQMKITGPFISIHSNKNPGPGSYNHQSTLDQNTFILRSKNPQQDKEKLKFPEPGRYPLTFCLNKEGKYFLSRYKNTNSMNFSQQSKRSDSKQNMFPGPGAYKPNKVEISPDGKYCLSKMRNVFSRKFGKSKRTGMERKTDSPGPGNYKIPSEFGHYLDKRVGENKLRQ